MYAGSGGGAAAEAALWRQLLRPAFTRRALHLVQRSVSDLRARALQRVAALVSVAPAAPAPASPASPTEAAAEAAYGMTDALPAEDPLEAAFAFADWLDGEVVRLVTDARQLADAQGADVAGTAAAAASATGASDGGDEEEGEGDTGGVPLQLQCMSVLAEVAGWLQQAAQALVPAAAAGSAGTAGTTGTSGTAGTAGTAGATEAAASLATGAGGHSGAQRDAMLVAHASCRLLRHCLALRLPARSHQLPAVRQCVTCATQLCDALGTAARAWAALTGAQLCAAVREALLQQRWTASDAGACACVRPCVRPLRPPLTNSPACCAEWRAEHLGWVRVVVSGAVEEAEGGGAEGDAGDATAGSAECMWLPVAPSPAVAHACLQAADMARGVSAHPQSVAQGAGAVLLCAAAEAWGAQLCAALRHVVDDTAEGRSDAASLQVCAASRVCPCVCTHTPVPPAAGV